MKALQVIRPADGIKSLLGLGLSGVLLWVLGQQLNALNMNALWLSFQDVTPVQWTLAGVFTAISFTALGRYDVVIHRVLNTGISDALALRSGMTGIALAQVLGFGLITGSLVRWRMLSALSLPRCSALTVFSSGSFLVSLAALIGLTLALTAVPLPAWVQWSGGVLFICIALCVFVAPLRLPTKLAIHFPSWRAARTIFFWTAVDTFAASCAFYVLLPATYDILLIHFFAVYLIALAAGLLSNAPGGLGAFELILIALLPEVDAAQMVASILAFRFIYYAVPACIAICGLIKIPSDEPSTQMSKIDFTPHVATSIAAQSEHAEAGLIYQRQTAFLSSQLSNRHAEWLVAPLAHYLVAIGRPLNHNRSNAQSIDFMIKSSNECVKTPLFYKVGQRSAVSLRKLGFTCFEVAQEAIVIPSEFSLIGPHSRQLRRMVRKANAVNVRQILPFDPLPMADMVTINQLWKDQRGGERGLSMGRFCPDYIARQTVFLAYHGAQLVGFVTFHISATEWTLDLVRTHPNAPNGTCHLLMTQALEAAQDASIPRLSLAAATCPKEGVHTIAQRIVSHWQDAGLRRFKASFSPRWEPLYIAAPSRLHLLLGAACVFVAINYPNRLAKKTNSPHNNNENYEFAFNPRA